MALSSFKQNKSAFFFESYSIPLRTTTIVLLESYPLKANLGASEYNTVSSITGDIKLSIPVGLEPFLNSKGVDQSLVIFWSLLLTFKMYWVLSGLLAIS